MKKMEVPGTTVSTALKTQSIIIVSAFFLLALSHDAVAQNRGSQMLPSASASRPRRVTTQFVAVNTRSTSVSAAAPSELDVAAQLEQRIFQLVNEERTRHGLSPLNWDQDLNRVARSHSTNMGLNTFFAHKNLEGQSPKDRMVRAGIKSFRRFGENIAYNWGNEDPAAFAVERWMLSEGHRENILGKFDTSAIGVFIKPNGAVYITQDFISR